MENTAKRVRVAISADFLTSYSRISKDKQNQVKEFIEKFKSDPRSPGLNYETLTNVKDKNLRSVRVNRQYRAIILKPATGNIYMLLWVDNHDDAYAWAQNRKFEIHPDTGALQVIEVSHEIEAPAPIIAEKKPGLFDSIRDRELLKLGIPLDLLPLVRSIDSEEALEAEDSKIPEEAYEALYLLAAGYSIEDVYREVVAPQASEIVDAQNFEVALNQPDSQRRFAFVEDDTELREILTAPLERWRVFLHPSQRKIVQMQANGPVRVLGGAGTGKTVVAMHRAKWLAENVFNGSNDRILFTTFTRNLATDIRENLTRLCPLDVTRRIEVINIDNWVSYFLKQNGYEYEIVFEQRWRELWENAVNMADDALGLSEQFYRDEWEHVIQQQGISNLSAYQRASRTGRGQALGRRDRAKVWPVFEEYRAQLNDHHFKELVDAVRDSRHILETRGDVLPYKSIIVDEAQDMSAEVFRLIRQMIPSSEEAPANDIFITGDAHQRIYNHKIVLSHCGINIRGRGRKLRVNYRTTEETRRWAINLLKGHQFDDLDDGVDDQAGYRSLMHGPRPLIKTHETFAEEIKSISSKILALAKEDVKDIDICLVARTHDLLGQYEGALRSLDIETFRVHRNVADQRKVPGVRLATMHRVKGLEFEHVIIAGVNEGVVPLPQAIMNENEHEKAESEVRERSLLYVAATRAKQSVMIGAFGIPSEFIKQEKGE